MTVQDLWDQLENGSLELQWLIMSTPRRLEEVMEGRDINTIFSQRHVKAESGGYQ